MVLLPLRRPAPPRQPPVPDPLEPRRKELEGAPAGPAPFAVEPFLQAVEVVAEQEGAEALGSLQWSLLGRPRLRSLLEGAASRGADGFQSLLRERYPAVLPGDAEGYLLAIRAHLRALLQDGDDTAVEPTGVDPAATAPALPLRKPLAGGEPRAGGGALASAAAPPALGAGEPLAGAQRRRLESAFADSFPEVRLHHGSEAARLSRSLGARAFTYGSDVVFGAQQYAPGTASGDALLAHELAHVLQQRGAGPSGPQAPGAGLERQADQAAADVMARLWGQEILGTMDLPAPQPLSRSGLALSGCSKGESRKVEKVLDTKVSLDVGDISNELPVGNTKVEVGNISPPELKTKMYPKISQTNAVKHDQALANMTQSNPGDVYILFAHGAIPDRHNQEDGPSQAIGMNAVDHTIYGDEIKEALASSNLKNEDGKPVSCAPTLFIAGGCASSSLLRSINESGTPIAMGFSRKLSGKNAGKSIAVFMDALKNGDKFSDAKEAAEKIAKDDLIIAGTKALSGDENRQYINQELVVVSYREGFDEKMNLQQAMTKHRQEAWRCP